MTDADGDKEYDDTFVDKLELLWGDGYLSPGGPAEVAAILDGVEVGGRDVLDIGCGTGGIDLSLVQDYGAATVHGLDVEETVIGRAAAAAEAAGLSDRARFSTIAPGPLPIADAAVDIVFSKDAMIHIPDKPAIYAEILRVLRPGGLFVASDWLKGFDRPYSAAMRTWIDAGGLSFEMASVAATERILSETGFSDVRLVRRDKWYANEVRYEAERISGPLKARAIELIGEGGWRDWMQAKLRAAKLLDSGEFCPAHIRATKPF